MSSEHATNAESLERTTEGPAPSGPPTDNVPVDLTASLPSATVAPADNDKTIISQRPPLGKDDLPLPQSPQLLAALLVGKRLEHYELMEFVGGGGMGAVFRATDTRLGRTVAIKVLSRDHTDAETIRRFRNEAQSAARLDHPNIARVYYVGEDRGWHFIVFEFIEGTNLRDVVDDEGPLDLERALNYTLQVAEALSHSSSREIVHRDIKPSNVLVTADGLVKLVDMGLARMHQVEAPGNDLTASGVTLGTFDYISPEQARDPRDADVRSDIYSLGCTLFFMLTGQPPFPDGTALQKLLKHNSDEPPDVRTFRPELPARVSALLVRMLSKRPSLRPQTPDELSGEIIVLGQQLGLPSVGEFGRVVLLHSAKAHDWWRKAWQTLAAVGLLCLGVVAGELVLSPRPAGGDVMPEPRFREPQTDVRAEDLKPEVTGLSNSEGKSAPFSVVEGSAPNDLFKLPLTTEIRSPQSALADSHPTAGPSTPSASSGLPEDADAADAAAKIKRMVVVGESPTPPEPHAEFFSGLGEACARAAELGATEIEMQFNGYHVEQPLEITNQRLTVRAAAGYRPVIVFRPPVRFADQPMIRLAGGSSAHVVMEGIDLRMELPADQPADGWSLFTISTGQSLELNQCALTVQNGDADSPPVHDDVTMIAVRRRRQSEAMSMGESQLAMGQQAKVTLERCIARGEANLVSMTDETPLTVRWNQGLLITSKHLLETGGTSTEPQYYEQIVLDLDNVMAYCREGLFYLRRGNGKAFQFHINSYADNCVFLTEPGVPLFEMVGLSGPPEADELQSTGEGNRFSPADMPFLFVRPGLGVPPLISKLGRRWSSETRSQAGVPWVKQPPLERQLHGLTKSDFQVEMDPALGTTGFDPLLLPEPAAASAAGISERATLH